MILIIRGHIRKSFETKNLYNLVKNIYNFCPDLKIFIHTWNIFANNKSWRNIRENNNIVSNDIIYNYFHDIKGLINHIIIDDDTNIELNGNLIGTINNNNMPLIGWKNYWYGKNKIIDYIYNKNIDENEFIINTRFDVLDNSNSLNENLIIRFIIKNIETKFTKNIFIHNYERDGIDNIYLGNINTMYKLINKFHYGLDEILNNNVINYDKIRNQEKLVYRVNNTIS